MQNKYNFKLLILFDKYHYLEKKTVETVPTNSKKILKMTDPYKYQSVCICICFRIY
jgi:hypothetical protein